MRLSASDLFQPGDGLGATTRNLTREQLRAGSAMVKPPKPNVRLRKGYRWTWSRGQWKQKKKSGGGIFGKVFRSVIRPVSRTVGRIAGKGLRVAAGVALPGVAQAAENFASGIRGRGEALAPTEEELQTDGMQAPGMKLGAALPLLALAGGAFLLMRSKRR